MTDKRYEQDHSTQGSLPPYQPDNTLSGFELNTLLQHAAGQRCLLGELLLMADRIEQSELDVCLMIQQHTGEKLGYILQRQGYITQQELDVALAFQSQQEASGEKSGPLQLGRLLLANKEISIDQLAVALEIQKLDNRRLGDILVEQGYLPADSVKRGLNMQNRLLGLALGTLLTAATVLSPDAALAGSMKVSLQKGTGYENVYSLPPTAAQMSNLYELAIRNISDSRITDTQSDAVDMLVYLAQNGYEPAQFTLGMIYLEQDFTAEQGLYWLKQAASTGNADAAFAVQNYENRDFGIGC